MKQIDHGTERRRFKRHGVSPRPIAVLGPDPIKVGHIQVISDEAIEIRFSESTGRGTAIFEELTIIIPDFNYPYLSGKIKVEAISSNPVDLTIEDSKLRKCVVPLTNMDWISRRHLKSACLGLAPQSSPLDGLPSRDCLMPAGRWVRTEPLNLKFLHLKRPFSR